jgi:anhydro-N-acetylmuramic acid kinase
MTPVRVAGTLSGTSADAVDVAVCEFTSGERPGKLALRLLAYREVPMDGELRGRLAELWREGAARLDELTELNVELGEIFAAAVVDTIEAEDIGGVDLIASHGQTIYHLVEPGRHRGTWQMGEPAVIAERTGVTVAADFRVADMAAGGEGAPLVPHFDALFFGHERVRALQNIGGIANVTFVGPDREPFAFDTGPGNALLDSAARHLFGEPYDRDGRHAAAGDVDDDLLSSLLAHPYFQRPPPKSTGREIFGEGFAADVIARGRERGLGPDDIMATLTALTVKSIAGAYRRFGPPEIGEVVLSGGGARNQTLVEALHRRLPGVTIRHHEEFGIPGAAKEAVAFALLGYETLIGLPGNLPACTGAAHPVILGTLAPGRNYPALMRAIFAGEDAWTPIEALCLAD